MIYGSMVPILKAAKNEAFGASLLLPAHVGNGNDARQCVARRARSRTRLLRATFQRPDAAALGLTLTVMCHAHAGWFSPRAEVTNGRAAMLGFGTLLLMEHSSGVCFF